MAPPPFYVFALEGLRFELPFSVFGADVRDTTVDLGPPWPLALGLGSSVAYLLLILLWPRGRVCLCRGGGFVHYVALFLYSFAVFAAVLAHLVAAGELTSLSTYACTPVPGWLRLVSLSFTVSKIWEWGDTLAMLERGDSLSKIGFLHLYHHATTFLLFLTVMNFSGAEKSGMLLNGFVHTLMYAHYAFRLPKAVRPFITAAQIVQLAFTTWLWHVTPALCPVYASFHKEHPLEFLVPYALVPVYLAFFLK